MSGRERYTPPMPTLAKRRPKVITIGPQDHGRRMSLDEFDRAVPTDGRLFELGGGTIQMSEIPGREHLAIFNELRRLLGRFDLEHPGVIDTIAGGSEAKMLIDPFESERHADLSVYLDPPPGEGDLWSTWIPALVVEIVSERSRKRDVEDKPAEYLAFGVNEYWVVDAAKNVVLVHERFRGDWRLHTLKPGQKLKTRQLPGLVVDVRKLIAAGKPKK
jgi:Uma2 family endonuclease